MASGMSQFCSRLANCCLLNLVPFGSRAGDLSVRPHTGSENFFFLHFHLVLGSRSMRSRLCVAPRAMGFGVGLALPCLWCLIFFFVWCESTAALGGRCWLFPDDGGALRCGGVGLAWLCRAWCVARMGSCRA